MDDKVLELGEVNRAFSSGMSRTHTVQAVDRMSFALERRKTFGPAGNSGRGKTTFSRVITRVPEPSGRCIRFEGEDIARLDQKGSRTYYQRMQIIFQNPETSLDSSMCIRDSLLEVTAIRRPGENREERMGKIRAVLGQVSLPDYLLSRYPHRISGGEGRRLAVCRALLLEPEVLLLDGPTSILDVSMQTSIINLPREFQEWLGLTYLCITHDIELPGWISHTTGVMQRGQLMEVSSWEQVMEAPVHPYARELLYPHIHWEGGRET